FTETDNVFLVDNVEDITINLNETPEYTFVSKAGEELDRFELKFEGLTTDIEDDNKQLVTNKNVLIYAINQQVTVKVTEELLRGKDRLIELYNLTGQLIGQYDLNGTVSEFELPKANTLYIVKVNIDSSSYQEKVIGLN
uniref:T9SS type A sorting domain-containing protein n=1 Tax=Labilibacter marinus TaxID=1477105 RepID=UPI0013014448